MRFDGVMAKAYNIKEDAFGEKEDYIKPRDIHPHMRSWVISLVLVVWAIFIADTFFLALLIGVTWLVTQWSFWRAKVKL